MGLGTAKPWNKVRSFNSNYSVIMSAKHRVGITFSAFDLLHAGHITMLEEAKRQCDYLICGLQTDPTIDRPEKNRPVQSVVERYIQLKGCKFVDEIVPYATEQDLEDILRAFKIDVRIIGDESIDMAEPLWRYFKTERFLELLRNSSLYFSSARQFEDPFEGAVAVVPFGFPRRSSLVPSALSIVSTPTVASSSTPPKRTSSGRPS